MFSVIIPLYNKSPYIGRAINSVLRQSFQEYEIIVVNDGSTDGGDELIEKTYSSQIKIIHQHNQGVSVARNTGIKNANFNYVAFLDADDFWHSDFLLSVQIAISKDPTVGIIGTGHINFDSDHSLAIEISLANKEKVCRASVYYNSDEYFKNALYNTLVCSSAAVMKKEFFDTNLGFDPQLKFGEDLDVWFRAILFYEKLLYIPRSLAYYSKEDGSAATTKSHHLEHTLIPKIVEEEYFKEDQAKNPKIASEFAKFRLKWIYLRLYPNYRLKENRHQIELLITKLPMSYCFLAIVYRIPFGIVHKLLLNRFTNRALVKYIEFCFTYIYRRT